MKYFGILLIIAATLISGCNNVSNNNKIAFLFPNMESGRYKTERVVFADKITSLGGEALIYDAGNNDQLQIRQAEEAIEKGAKVLVVNSINQNTAAAIVRTAHDAGVPVIGYDRIISNCDLDLYISFDNQKVGELMAQYIVKQKPSGNYVLLNGDKTDQNAILVRNGIMKVLQPEIDAKRINIMYDIYIEEWSIDNAQNETDKFLKYSQAVPDAIISSYDGISKGAILALKNLGITTPVLITGQDAELFACQYIAKGIQIMTVYKPFHKQAGLAAEYAIKLAKGEKINLQDKTNNGRIDVPTILIDPISVDASNIKQTVIADGFHTESEIYQQ
jgi:D-xylose transport system substrate-binding protein